MKIDLDNRVGSTQRNEKSLIGGRALCAGSSGFAIKVLDRAGHIAPMRKETPAQKALAEMTRDELAAFIDRNQAEIDKIEGELAARAKDVSPKNMYK